MDKKFPNLDKLISKTISFIVSKEIQAPRYCPGIYKEGSIEQKEFIEYLKRFGLNLLSPSKVFDVLGSAIYKNVEEIAEKEGLFGINKRLLYSLFSEKKERDKFKEAIKKSILNDCDYLENLIKAS
jgi:hypothetical protein